MKSLIVIAPLLMLAACQTPTPGQTQNEDACGANRHQSLIGTAEPDLNKSALGRNTRILHPDSVVTMDYSAERLNVYLDKDGKVSRVTCG